MDGQTVLVNGQKPDASTHTIKARSGTGIRLRLINSAVNRYFRVSVTGNGADNNLYRIGGEGGFLEKVRLEGGIRTGAGGAGWDTKYDVGEVVIGASGRSDVVVVPTGNTGDIITITGKGYARGGPASDNPAGDLLYIEIDNSPAPHWRHKHKQYWHAPYSTTFTIAAGDDILGPGTIDNLKLVATPDTYLDPADVPESGGVGSMDSVIRLNANRPGSTAIDHVIGKFEDSGPDYTQVPFQGATRYARVGDIIEVTLRNETQQHHPFHHHGFSFQPVRIVDNGADLDSTADDVTLYTFDYNEFSDVIDLFDGQCIVVRIRLDDRPRITDNRSEPGEPPPNQFFPSGGAAGRWVFHCHLFLHAATGMISELVVVNTDRDGDGYDTSEDCNDFDPAINPGAKEIPGDGIDNNCNGLIDEPVRDNNKRRKHKYGKDGHDRGRHGKNRHGDD